MNKPECCQSIYYVNEFPVKVFFGYNLQIMLRESSQTFGNKLHFFFSKNFGRTTVLLCLLKHLLTRVLDEFGMLRQLLLTHAIIDTWYGDWYIQNNYDNTKFLVLFRKSSFSTCYLRPVRKVLINYMDKYINHNNKSIYPWGDKLPRDVKLATVYGTFFKPWQNYNLLQNKKKKLLPIQKYIKTI